MRFQIFKTITFIVLVALLSSCFDDNSKDLEAWKTKNDKYFTNMKDSASFELQTIPNDYGGGNYYTKIIQQGNFEQTPDLLDTVVVNYSGMNVDGVVFQNTYSGTNPIDNPTAKPVRFIAGNLIAGWVFNLIEMTPGEVRTIVLPHYLAYGANGYGSIKGYSTLRFTIHLVSIKPFIEK